MIVAAPHARGAVFTVLAHAAAKRNGILGERAGAVRVAVTAVPEKGKANAAIQAVLAEALGCKPNMITLLSGETARQKRFLVDGMTADDLARRLASFVNETETRRASGCLAPKVPETSHQNDVHDRLSLGTAD